MFARNRIAGTGSGAPPVGASTGSPAQFRPKPANQRTGPVPGHPAATSSHNGPPFAECHASRHHLRPRPRPGPGNRTRNGSRPPRTPVHRATESDFGRPPRFFVDRGQRAFSGKPRIGVNVAAFHDNPPHSHLEPGDPEVPPDSVKRWHTERNAGVRPTDPANNRDL